jgi:membrane associated rhomboid family serine protease
MVDRNFRLSFLTVLNICRQLVKMSYALGIVVLVNVIAVRSIDCYVFMCAEDSEVVKNKKTFVTSHFLHLNILNILVNIYFNVAQASYIATIIRANLQ